VEKVAPWKSPKADFSTPFENHAKATGIPPCAGKWQHACKPHPCFADHECARRGPEPGLLSQTTPHTSSVCRLAGLWLETAVPDNAFELCADLGRRYGPKLGVRTLDSLHVACALELRTQRFLTFDDRQRKLAKAAGLNLR
jgi:hypothetical protein